MKSRFLSITLGGLVAVTAMLSLSFSSHDAMAAGRTQHFGPYQSSSPDSGTCGNDWATDTFNRDFTVDTRPNANGTYNVTEEFKNGSFMTMAGLSPGSCETNPGGTVLAGVTGNMHGSFTIVVSGGAYNANNGCSTGIDPCTTASFIATHFGTAATYEVPSYIFHYSAGSNGEWKNASADYGGDHGDITGAP